jgi:hypothetical protein
LTTVVRRFPTFEVDLITQNTSYVMRYDTNETAKQFTSGELEEALIQFYITNDMTNDSPVFTLVLLAKTKWDKILNPNDLIRVRVYPDRTKSKPDNPYILVGMLSDIHKEGEYVNGTLLYRLTGQAMTKALIDFQVGVIQEVSTILPSIGWLPDQTSGGTGGLNFTGNTASGIGDQLMSRFVYQYAQYAFTNGKTLHDYFIHSFSSWENDEYLSDTTSFVNYQGSVRQFLQDISAAPFNELFFEYANSGQCVAIMRPTPFDPDMWEALPTYRFTSDIVVEESYGKTDSEMYSVYTVSAPNLQETSSVDIGVFPKYNPELIKKYGYKEFSVENQYLLTPGSAVSTSKDGKGKTTTVTITSPAIAVPKYADVNDFLSQRGYLDKLYVRANKSMVYSDLLSAFQGLNDIAASDIVDTVIAGSFSSDMFDTIMKTDSVAQYDKAVNKEKTISPNKLDEFTQRLYNWYCENANFYSGDIRVLGNPAYRVGTRIYYDDLEENTTWEFYVESIEHDFDFTSGYTTILGVTRGLPNYGEKRFTNLWGQSSDFKGGYMGEINLNDIVQTAKSSMASTTNNSMPDSFQLGDTGGAGTMGAVQTAESTVPRHTVYRLGAGRTGKDPLQTTTPTMDCSSFVWWCFYENGIYLKGGPTGMTTKTIASDPKLQVIGNRGDDKNTVLSRMKQGDIIWFDTVGPDGHMGIYVGDGKCVACNTSHGVTEFSLNSTYWWKAFKGHVARYNG